MTSKTGSQFTRGICGQGFEQKSRLQRHMDISQPTSAPSAADLERALSGIQYPKSKEALVKYVSQKLATVDKNVFSLIECLPNRTYRNSPGVAMALGELKSGKGFRSEKQAEATEQPSKKGGKAAVRSSVSAASIAKVLSGIDFLRYEKTPELRERCPQFTEYLMGDIDVLT